MTEDDVVTILQALLDRHAMLRLRVGDDGSGGWSLSVPEPGTVDARTCVRHVDAVTDEEIIAGRSRLDPSAGAMLSALWEPSAGHLVMIVHHLAVDGVSWRILLEDVNLAWAQLHGGRPVSLPAVRTSFQRWATLLSERAHRHEVVAQLDTWRQITAIPPALPALQPDIDTYADAGSLAVDLDVTTTRMLLGEVPAAFHAGIHEILLIAFALAVAEFAGTAGQPVALDVEGHGRDEELARDADLSRTVGWFTTKYPVAIGVGALDWSEIVSGSAALGALIKDAKEQLRAMPDGLTYGLLRYLNDEVDLGGSDPAIGFNYLGRLGGPEASGDIWDIRQDGSPAAGRAAAIPMPLTHTVELNAGTVDVGFGPQLRAGWTWAPSALDAEQVNRLSRLWFDALTGICVHVRAGGGGLTPSDISPARLSQPQIDQLCATGEVGDILPLTPLQQGLLFHAGAGGGADDVYAVQLGITLTGRLDRHRLREAVRAAVGRHPNVMASFCARFDQPVQMIPVDPEVPWRYVELDSAVGDLDGQVEQVCAEERAAVYDLAEQPGLRVALIRVGDGTHRCVVTNHHILLDGWSLPILLQEIFAGYYGQRLPAPVRYRRFVDWLYSRDRDAARAVWRDYFTGFGAPTLVGPADQLGVSPRNTASLKIPEHGTRALGELARAHHTTVSTVLQAAFAQVLMSITGHRDVAFGIVVSGRPAELAGADRMVGLLINTVPVRATVTGETTAADLLDQLHSAHNHTFEHEHLALAEIHRATGHRQLFDSVFVYENYPTDTALLSGADGLAITGVSARDYYHYPLAIQAAPGAELDLRLQYSTAAFTDADIHTLTERFRRVLSAMTTDPTQPLEVPGASLIPPLGHRDSAVRDAVPETFAEQILADIYSQILGIDTVGVNDSFFDLGGDSLSAMRAVAAIDAALGTRLAATTLVEAPTVRGLSLRLGEDGRPAGGGLGQLD